MGILDDLGKAFNCIDVDKLSGEVNITKKLSEEINKLPHTTAAIELPYYGQYAGSGKRCTNSTVFNRCYPIFNADSHMPVHVDLTLSGGVEVFLVEAKYLGQQIKGDMKYGMAFCADKRKEIDQLMHYYPRTSKKFLTDNYDGVVWADICRLLEVHSYCKCKGTMPRLFQAYYVHTSQTSFTTNLVKIYEEYYKAVGNPCYGDYVITKGNFNERHGWKIHPFQQILCHTSPVPSPAILFPPCHQPLSPTPLTYDKSSKYKLYLIEIIP